MWSLRSLRSLGLLESFTAIQTIVTRLIRIIWKRGFSIHIQYRAIPLHDLALLLFSFWYLEVKLIAKIVIVQVSILFFNNSYVYSNCSQIWPSTLKIWPSTLKIWPWHIEWREILPIFCFSQGIIGSGFALQVIEQKKKQHNRKRRRPAAMLIQVNLFGIFSITLW